MSEIQHKFANSEAPRGTMLDESIETDFLTDPQRAEALISLLVTHCGSKLQDGLAAPRLLKLKSVDNGRWCT